MPYSNPIARRVGRKLTIEIDLPDRGELSQRGRAENLVDPTKWIDLNDGDRHLAIKVTVCKPLPRVRR